MPDYRRLILIIKDGKEILRGDYDDVAEFFGLSSRYIQMKAQKHGCIHVDNDVYKIVRTDEKIPKKKDMKETPVKPKKNYTIAQINQMAKKAKMSYGQYVASMR